MIKDPNGNFITIDYVDNCAEAQRVGSCSCSGNPAPTCGQPPRQAINFIRDTLGRHITFHYDTVGNLAEIRVPGYNGGPDRVLVKFGYSSIILSPSFSLSTENMPPNNQVNVLEKVYFPDTGRGYRFEEYSNYGMCARISNRVGMTASSDGTEIGYTRYIHNTTGTLDDAPQFTERQEWWSGKTDDQGNAVSSTQPAKYLYQRILNETDQTEALKTTMPDLTVSEMVMSTDPAQTDFGLVRFSKVARNNATVSRQDFTYSINSAQGGLQRTRIIATDDGTTAKQTRLDVTYGAHGRLTEVVEFGFPEPVGGFKARRRTVYTYDNDPEYIDKNLLRLVSEVNVFDADPLGNPSNPVKISRTKFTYDGADLMPVDQDWGIQTYGLSQGCAPPTCAPPPSFDTSKINRAHRGNITKVESWSDATSNQAADISFRHRFDIFGNEVKAQLSCCSLKRFTFSSDLAGMHYAHPSLVTDGPESNGPTLTNSAVYDFNTSFVKSHTNPNSLTTTFAPDAAMRLRTMTYPSLAVMETFFPGDPAFGGSEGLLYKTKLTYTDGTTQKVLVTNQWMDGIGHIIRAGSGAGDNPTSFDAVKVIYDEMGRVRKQTNPYTTTSSDGNISGLPNPTTYDYDALSRVVQVTSADTVNKTVTLYNGPIITETDPVGRKRESELDGLGRVIRVTEMDAAKNPTWHTTNTYDMNDNLISVNQGGQARSYKYDSLSRLKFSRTPEEAATISDGATGLWSNAYTYTPFGAVSTHRDARNVLTTFQYDELNRLRNVSYSTTNPNVASTAPVTIEYGTGIPDRGMMKRVIDSVGQEDYFYDSLSRLQKKTRTFSATTDPSLGAKSYDTEYTYNQMGQLKSMKYPSGRVVGLGYDTRGRLLTMGGQITGVTYTPAQQVATITLGNGTTETYDYSADLLQLTRQRVTKGATTLMDLTYGYAATASSGGGTQAGNTGQLMSITGAVNGQARDESYSYDQVGRLEKASGWGNTWQRKYEYDRWGNRTKVWNNLQGTGTAVQRVTLGQTATAGVPNNRIATLNEGAAWQYDEAGNVKNDTTHTYKYDAENRIVKVDEGTGGEVRYSYDSANRRVKKVAGGQATYYIWEESEIIAEYGSGSTEPAGARYHHPDPLSMRVKTDAIGAVKGTQSHLPYGEDGPASITGEAESRRFTSYDRDSETSTDYAINRQYSHSTARFLRPDPIEGSPLNPQSLNRYIYTNNDPINLIDPLGLEKICTEEDGKGGWRVIPCTAEDGNIEDDDPIHLETWARALDNLNNWWLPNPNYHLILMGETLDDLMPPGSTRPQGPTKPPGPNSQQKQFDDCARDRIRTWRRSEYRSIGKITGGMARVYLGTRIGGPAITLNMSTRLAAGRSGARITGYSSKFKAGEVVGFLSLLGSAVSGDLFVSGFKDSYNNRGVLDKGLEECRAMFPNADHSTRHIFFTTF